MLITIPEFRITINWTEKDKRLPKSDNYISGFSPPLWPYRGGREIILFNIRGSKGHA